MSRAPQNWGAALASLFVAAAGWWTATSPTTSSFLESIMSSAPEHQITAPVYGRCPLTGALVVQEPEEEGLEVLVLSDAGGWFVSWWNPETEESVRWYAGRRHMDGPRKGQPYQGHEARDACLERAKAAPPEDGWVSDAASEP